MSNTTARLIQRVPSSEDADMAYSNESGTIETRPLNSPLINPLKPPVTFQPFNINDPSSSTQTPRLSTEDVFNQMDRILAMVAEESSQAKRGVTVGLNQLTEDKQRMYQEMNNLYLEAQNNKRIIGDKLFLIQTSLEAIE